MTLSILPNSSPSTTTNPDFGTETVSIHFETLVSESEKGAEQRRALWENPIRAFSISWDTLLSTQITTLIDFYEARQGRFAKFKFKSQVEKTKTLESVGTGDNTTTLFTLDKKYVDSSNMTIYIDTVETSAYIVVDNENYGQITFSSAPLSGEVITATYDYYWPVRFNQDTLQPTNSYGAVVFRLAIELIEVKNG